jgi:uncharacterized protein YihD (DUF1040 family)
MRDPKRIKELLKQLETIWMKNPDLRFFQLLLNVFNCDTGMFFYQLEDDKIIDQLKQYSYISKEYKQQKKRSKK